MNIFLLCISDIPWLWPSIRTILSMRILFLNLDYTGRQFRTTTTPLENSSLVGTLKINTRHSVNITYYVHFRASITEVAAHLLYPTN